MLRPDPEEKLFGYIPVRLIMSLLLLVAVVLAIVLVLGIEHEKNLVENMAKATELPPEKFLGLVKFQEDLVKIILILFLLSGIGISAIVTYQSYYSTKRTLEQVKSLARNILGSIPSGILTINRDGQVTAINPAAEKVLHLNASQALGQHYFGLFKEGDPIRELLTRALTRSHYELDQDISYSAGISKPITVRVMTSELKDPHRENAGVLLLLKDVSELLVLEQQLRRSEKLSALHTLSAGVAHEIRNPLSAVDLNLHLLEQELPDQQRSDPEVTKYLDILNVEVQRLKDILDNFMRFSRPLPLKLEQVHLTEVIQHILKLLEHEAHEKKVRFEADIPHDLPVVRGDETALSQVFLNIIINAIQSMPQGGVLKVSARVKDEGGSPSVEMWFSDTGDGVTKKDLARLFEPFYSTKEQGSGLGLAIAYRIVEDHQGTIHVESQEGTGTTVFVQLPCSEVLKEAEQV
jgi:PAS domain S-box-containing protein